MRLRSQLLLVSLLVLLLPWAGCSYVAEMERALRQGQQDSLVAVTRSIASAINAQPELIAELDAAGGAVNDAKDIYWHELARPLSVDGYRDPEVLSDADQVIYQREPLALSAWFLTAGGKAYVFAQVDDDKLSFRNPTAGGVSGSDYLQLDFEAEDGTQRRFWISPEAPGEFTALRNDSGRLISEIEIRGAWRDAPGGYSVEFELPRDWLQNRFGIIAVDGDDPSNWAGSKAPGEQPGRSISRSLLLADQLERFSQTNLHLSVIDGSYWLRSASGTVNFEAEAASKRAPGAWLVEALYRLAVPEDTQGASFVPAQRGQLRRDEVTRALDGQQSSTWYPTDSGNDLAIVSAAMPLGESGQTVGAVVAESSSAGILTLTNAALVRLVGISLLTMALIVTGLLGYASWLSLRIRRLSRQVSLVMEPQGRELREFPAQNAGDEIGTLGRSFGRLLDSVRGYTDYLQTLAAKLSHELRTPLAVVRSSLDNLEHENLSAEAARYLKRARDGGDRLEHIIAAMSAASRVEQSINSAESQSVDLTELMRNIVAGYRSVYDDVVIECRVPDESLMVHGNAELLAQMLDKLMDNARDFCPDKGTITFELDTNAQGPVMSVANDGPVLPAALAAQLFESMVSVRDSNDADLHMGLGLTIVRQVAEFHGGTATARNRAAGDGVVFSVQFPRPAEP